MHLHNDKLKMTHQAKYVFAPFCVVLSLSFSLSISLSVNLKICIFVLSQSISGPFSGMSWTTLLSPDSHQNCYKCQIVGASLSCCWGSCSRRYHYICAKEIGKNLQLNLHQGWRENEREGERER